MFGLGRDTAYVTPASAVDGDDLLATKSAAIEATAVLASTFPQHVRRRLGRNTLNRSLKLVHSVSTVKDSSLAASVGLHDRGVTAMHDVTEGGVLSAVLDIAEASGLTATVNREEIPVNDEVEQVCRLFRIDPLLSLGQGCLIIASRPHRTSKAVRKLRSAGIRAQIIGKLSKGRGPSTIRFMGSAKPLVRPSRDPYWGAYWRNLKSRLH